MFFDTLKYMPELTQLMSSTWQYSDTFIGISNKNFILIYQYIVISI